MSSSQKITVINARGSMRNLTHNLNIVAAGKAQIGEETYSQAYQAKLRSILRCAGLLPTPGE